MDGLELFFIYGTELPPDVGFEMFGPVHLLWIFAGTVLSAGLCLAYKKTKAKRGFDRAVGAALLFLILIREVYLAVTGHLSVFELPLHLCSLAGIFCFVHSLKNFDWLGQVLYSLCLPGTLVAIVFPDWIYYPPVHFITLQGFLFHFGVALYVICQLISGRIRPDIRKLWKVFVFLAVIVPLIYLFNRRFGTNYFFVNTPSAGSPLEWLASFMGNPGYLIGYAVLAVAVTSLLDLAYMGFRRLSEKNRGKTKEQNQEDIR